MRMLSRVLPVALIALMVFLAVPMPVAARSNTFPQGFCTWYVAQNWPTSQGVEWNGNASEWYGKATGYGWAESNDAQKPKVNAIAVWGNGAGHVALVVGVSGSSITVKEMNWGDRKLPGADDPKSPNYGKWSNWNIEKTNTIPLAQVNGRGGLPFIGYVYAEKHTPPAQPNGLSTSVASRTQINLRWNATPTATSYKVYRWTGGGPWQQIATVNGTTYSSTGLRANTHYSYRIRAVNQYGDSPDSNVASATTQR